MDSDRWSRCNRFDGKTQPCICWFARRQRELVAAGDWPGGDMGMLSDWLEMVQHHGCHAPFDGSSIYARS
jgi:hypothetical protein